MALYQRTQRCSTKITEHATAAKRYDTPFDELEKILQIAIPTATQQKPSLTLRVNIQRKNLNISARNANAGIIYTECNGI